MDRALDKELTNPEENFSDEEWRTIAGYEGIYEVSNLGRIRSLQRKVWNYTKPGRILKSYVKPNGYAHVGLRGYEKSEKHAYVHRVVAQAFIPNPDEKCDINHKNSNKLDNRVCNLEWATRQENILHFRASALAAKYDESKSKTLYTKSLQHIQDYKKQVLYLYDTGISIKCVAEKLGIGKERVHDILIIFDKL